MEKLQPQLGVYDLYLEGICFFNFQLIIVKLPSKLVRGFLGPLL